MNVDSEFINALKNNDLETLQCIPKSDAHNHGTRGGNINYVLKGKVEVIPKCPDKLYSLDQMLNWYNENLEPHCSGIEGFERRVKGAFHQAKIDGVSELVLSFSIDHREKYGNDYREYVNRLSEIHTEIAPEVNFYPEISFTRTDKIKPVMESIDEILDLNFFTSIDLKGNELESVDNFVEIFRKAKQKDLILRAHVGEFGNPESIIEVIEKLKLDEIHHGNQAINSKKVMNYLRDNQITLNICPTSNVILGNVDEFKNHPIGKLYRYGIPVTINTDDVLKFNKGVSDEYLNLYKEKVLSAEELNEIRIFGLKSLRNIVI